MCVCVFCCTERILKDCELFGHCFALSVGSLFWKVLSIHAVSFVLIPCIGCFGLFCLFKTPHTLCTWTLGYVSLEGGTPVVFLSLCEVGTASIL